MQRNLAALLCALLHLCTLGAASSVPVNRTLAEDLTVVLAEELRSKNVEWLVVLSDCTSAKLDFRRILKDIPVHCNGDFSHVASKQRPASIGSSSNDSPQRRQQHGGAVLLTGAKGTIALKQVQLLLAAGPHRRSRIHLYITYTVRENRGDSLSFSGMKGDIYKVAFKSTNVFRDEFNRIYAGNLWGSGDHNGQGSGLGSNMEYTAVIRPQLVEVIKTYNINSMLDSSCGSMHWMRLVLEEVAQFKPDFKFMGTDVSCNVIEQHKQTFANKTNWSFACVDYANMPLPSGYELVFSRDSLQHVPQYAVWMFLNNVRNSGAKYLMVGSYVESRQQNKDVPAGGNAYDVDLLKPPFNARNQLMVIDEHTKDGKHQVLFDLSTIVWDDPLIDLDVV